MGCSLTPCSDAIEKASMGLRGLPSLPLQQRGKGQGVKRRALQRNNLGLLVRASLLSGLSQIRGRRGNSNIVPIQHNVEKNRGRLGPCSPTDWPAEYESVRVRDRLLPLVFAAKERKGGHSRFPSPHDPHDKSM